MSARLLALAAVVAMLIAGCSASTPATGGSDGIRVVAAENFWGSIAVQLGGKRADVQSLIVNPATDPHSYEPDAADARALATAQLVILNGVGYDPWGSRLLAANPSAGRTVLTVGELFGLREGDNPHRWYDPADVDAAARAITADLQRIEPRDGPYFARRLLRFENRGLARYRQLISSIRSRYHGIPVGASESLFALQAPALGLRLLTPYSFMKAVSEGTEVSARDTFTTQQQITTHQIKVWIDNTQNAAPEIQRLNDLARRHGIPIVAVTETLSPANVSFEAWQVAQLVSLEHALQKATGR